MKKSDKLKLLSLACVIAVSLFSCKEKNEDIPKEENLNYFTRLDIPVPYEILVSDNVKYIDDMIYLTGISYSAESTNLIRIYDTATGATEEYVMDSVESGVMDFAWCDEEQIYVGYRNDVSVKLDIVNREKNDTRTIQLGMGSKIADFCIAENTISLLVKRAGNIIEKVCCDILTGEIVDTIYLDEKIHFEPYENIEDAIFINDICCVITRISSMTESKFNLYVFSPDMLSVNKYEDILHGMNGVYECVYENSRGNLCVCTVDDGKRAYRNINEIETMSGQVINTYEDKKFSKYPILSKNRNNSYDFVFCKENVLYSYNADDVSEKSVAEFEHLNDIEEYYRYASHSGEEIIIGVVNSEDAGEQVIYTLDENGIIQSSVSAFDIAQRGIAGQIVVMPDGNYCTTEELTNGCIIYITDDQGKELSRITPGYDDEISDLKLADTFVDVTQNGEIYLMSTFSGKDRTVSYIHSFDKNGKETSDFINIGEITDAQSIFEYKGKEYILSCRYNESPCFYRIEREKGEVHEENNFVLCDKDVIKVYNKEDKLYYHDYNGIYVLDNEGKTETVVNWSYTDIFDEVTDSYIIDNEKVICITNSKGVYELGMLQQADKETVEKIKNKKIIKVAGDVSSLSQVADKFNDTSDGYRVQLVDYYKGQHDEEKCLENLNNDILSGNIPDIFIGNSNLDLQMYISKNMFSNLNEYFEKDATISKDDYLKNVMDCFVYDGKQYLMPVSFYISTLIGKESLLGVDGWTFDELFRFADEKNIFYNYSRSQLVNLLIENNITEFVDYEAMSADFDSEIFVRLIEYIKKNGIADDDYLYYSQYPMQNEVYKNYFVRFTDDFCCVDERNVFNLRPIAEYKYGYIGEEIVYKGYPSNERNGNLVYTKCVMGISDKSEVKDGAWEFLKLLISDEYRNALGSMCFPIKISSFEKNLSESEKSSVIHRADGTFFKTEDVSETDIEKLRAVINSDLRPFTKDSSINAIIDEELEIYFNTFASAEETAKIIQSKVNLYLSGIK